MTTSTYCPAEEASKKHTGFTGSIMFNIIQINTITSSGYWEIISNSILQITALGRVKE